MLTTRYGADLASKLNKISLRCKMGPVKFCLTQNQGAWMASTALSLCSAWCHADPLLLCATCRQRTVLTAGGWSLRILSDTAFIPIKTKTSKQLLNRSFLNYFLNTLRENSPLSSKQMPWTHGNMLYIDLLVMFSFRLIWPCFIQKETRFNITMTFHY